METEIRKVRQGDENTLAYIQTESWKAAFAGILDAETLTKYTDINRAAAITMITGSVQGDGLNSFSFFGFLFLSAASGI